MYKTLRTQVNLRFTNEDVFNNLVEPLKASRELSGLIVKLLTLYYSNKETRSLVRRISLLDDVLSIKDNDGVSNSVVSGTDMSLKDKTLERKSEDIQLKAQINNLENKMNEILSILESNKDSTTSDMVSNIPLEDSSLNKQYQAPAIEKIPEPKDVAITNQEVSQVSIIGNVPEPQDVAIVNQEGEDASTELGDILNDLLEM